MKKLMLVGLTVAGFATFSFASEAAKQEASTTQPKQEVVEEEEESSLELGFDVDFYSAYVFRNAVYSDRPVAQPCVWGDWTIADPIYIGFYVWQNYDLSARRHEYGMRGEWNETDYNIHIGTTLWSNDDSELTLEFGHEWYTYNLHGKWEDGVSKSKDYPTTYEFYVKSEFENPIVTPYMLWSWDYMRVNGMYLELGLKKEQNVAELFDSENDTLSKLTLFADWNVNGGSKKYLSYMYAVDRGEYDKNEKTGIAGTTIKAGLTYNVCDHFSISGVIAFTSILNQSVRDDMEEDLYGCLENKDDLVWGGVQAKLSF
ncbi:MAG: hypothetical protein J6V88_03950 [Kiritimatiellae bacterium]|nr:hypothetical protein [Kiritimatiellia bacterium]